MIYVQEGKTEVTSRSRTQINDSYQSNGLSKNPYYYYATWYKIKRQRKEEKEKVGKKKTFLEHT